ncbi:hypothetical protein DAI22_03g144800 [Oryza sativa Japonica Group]|nr:hypothetical protein DAI22_03g144800 [Oryza sativa Japonica Group]
MREALGEGHGTNSDLGTSRAMVICHTHDIPTHNVDEQHDVCNTTSIVNRNSQSSTFICLPSITTNSYMGGGFASIGILLDGMTPRWRPRGPVRSITSSLTWLRQIQ